MGSLTLIRRHLARHVVGYLALFVALGGTGYAAARIGSAQIVDGSVRSVDIADGTIRARDVRNGTLRNADVARGGLLASRFAPGELPGGARGPAGAPGPAGPRGTSFGDGVQVANVTNLACDVPVVVGSLPLTLAAPSRIWVNGHGVLVDDDAPTREYGLFVQLRDASGAQVLAASPAAWDSDAANADADDSRMPLSTGGVLLSELGGLGDGRGSAAYLAAPGGYVLTLTALATAGPTPCTTALPDFGHNQGNGLSYLLLGTAP